MGLDSKPYSEGVVLLNTCTLVADQKMVILLTRPHFQVDTREGSGVLNALKALLPLVQGTCSSSHSFSPSFLFLIVAHFHSMWSSSKSTECLDTSYSRSLVEIFHLSSQLLRTQFPLEVHEVLGLYVLY